MWRFFLSPQALPLGASGFLLSLNHDCVACQLQRAEVLRKGSHEGPLFWMFSLSLQSIISNQMRPRRLRGAWFSRLLRHPARIRSGSVLSPRTHTGSPPRLLTAILYHEWTVDAAWAVMCRGHCRLAACNQCDCHVARPWQLGDGCRLKNSPDRCCNKISRSLRSSGDRW